MAGKPKRMSQIKQLLQLHQQGKGIKSIARSLSKKCIETQNVTVQLPDMNCLSANACGRMLSLHCITLQGCTSFHHLSFHSAPLWLFLHTLQITQPKREASLHSTPSAKFHSVVTLAFPNPVSGMPNRIVCSRKQEAKKISCTY